MTAVFGEYIVYVDESGDHGLESVDPHYPVFVLAFCIFRKQEYALGAVPELLEFKFKYFGHDQVVLHEHDIKKAKGAFRILVDADLRPRFFNDLSLLIERLPFTLVAVVIRKEDLKSRYRTPENPYTLAMELGLERVCSFLGEKGQVGRTSHVIFERRGRKEDLELEVEFRRLTSGGNATCSIVPLDIVFTDKKSISTGLQLADLIARPIGLHVLRPDQPNRTWPIIETKLRRSQSGKVEGYGLKCFP